jgi:hypothetical protein
VHDYTTATTISSTPAEVYAAIQDVRGWWNTATEGATTEPGDEFGFEIPGLHRIRVRVVAMAKDETIEWTVLENEFGFINDQSEWVGNRIVFDLQRDGDGTRLTFTQRGLVPTYECYDVCSNAWAFFIGESLRSLAESGVGQPETAAGEAAPADKARAAVEQHEQRKTTALA